MENRKDTDAKTLYNGHLRCNTQTISNFNDEY